MAHARWLLGNSSAGLLEAPSLKLPVINIGDRQKGRLKPANVIDTPLETAAIRNALGRALRDDFRAGMKNLTNPYGDGHAAKRIIATLGTFLRPLQGP
jgi:UDP-N-acetylglucosamine 2-epimerase